jgi:tetratricopeptide (TPR) repeat protein
VRGAPLPLVISGSFLLCPSWPASARPGPASDPPASPATSAEKTTPSESPTPSLPFEEVAAKAARARETGALDEAARWYRSAVKARPQWDEGWWYLATLSYEKDRYAEARDAFTRFLALRPGPGPAPALRGLCEFELKEYEASLRDLEQWQSEGSPGNAETRDVAWYHLSVLRIRGGQFELALEPISQLCRSQPESRGLVRVAGLMLVRKASFPEDVPREKQEQVDAAGRAIYSWLALRNDEAQARFKELIDRFPDTPNAHYCYGLFLKREDPEGAFEQFQEEMRVQPDSVYPRLEMAYALIGLGEYARARSYAEDSARMAPGLFAAHHALGQVLVEMGDLPRGIAELEEAARLAPESYQMFYALARAYGKAGRKEDAARARATGQRLDAIRRAKMTEGAQGGAETSSPSPP